MSKENVTIIREAFELVAKNAKLPGRSLKKLQENWSEDGIVFSNNKDKTEVKMSFGPEVNISRLLDAEVEFMNCIVHVTLKPVVRSNSDNK